MINSLSFVSALMLETPGDSPLEISAPQSRLPRPQAIQACLGALNVRGNLNTAVSQDYS